ncbi:MAG TPA: type I methionyl aminopeptidase [Myxococcota bacterium]|nr:type I methionyl aminopeptidase [Myxococcota bacterium]
MIQIKSKREIDKMREAGRHVGEILVRLASLVRPGVTTGELDRAARDEIRARKLVSSFLDYAPGGAPPFPAVLCASVNEEIVHGIPGARRLAEGDVVKLDFGAICDGYHADAALSLPVGRVDDESRRLMAVTRASLESGIRELVPGKRLGDVGAAVQDHVEREGFSVVRDFVGHGIGRAMHEPPQLPNFGKPGRGQRLREGMVFAIEPMVNAGTWQVEVLADGWTAVTADRRRSAHFEHTVAITDHGPEILTRVPGTH